MRCLSWLMHLLRPLYCLLRVPTPAVAKALGLNETYLQSLMELPGTETMLDLKERLAALAQWNASLRK